VINLQQETFNEFMADAFPLLVANNAEIDLFGLPLNMDFAAYQLAEEADILRIYTVRENNRLIGYCVFVITDHAHHKDLRMASQDVIYISPNHRSCGLRLLRYTEERLKEEGVNGIMQSAPVISRLGPVLERLGYDKMETNYFRRI